MSVPDQITHALTSLFSTGQVIEIRAIGEDSMASGYYSDFSSAVRDARLLESDRRIQGIYVTLNDITPALLARRENRIKTRLGKKDATTADSDIVHRRWFPIDIDPVRPSGVSSSEEEHDAALARAVIILDYLKEMGWPDPIMGDSGNGAHLLYPIDLPNDTESRDLVKQCLESLDIRFSDERCKVDTANFNAGRIWKLYGTISRKGDNTKDRPHRRARILSCPEPSGMVPKEALTILAGMFPRQSPDYKPPRSGTRGGSGTSSNTIDLSKWLQENGIGYEERPYTDGRLFVLDECPFSGAHKDGAYAIQFSNGAIFAGCHHTSCGSGEQRWTDLRSQYDGEKSSRSNKSGQGKRNYDQWRKEQIRDRAKAKAEYFGNISEKPRTPSIGVTEKARDVLWKGNPLIYILKTFSADHEGDRVIAECLAMSLASRSVINSKGLHVLVTGDSGKGKSHAFDVMLSQVPDEYRLSGRMSDKALFYAEGLRPGSVIALDDVSLSDQMQEVLKGVTTSFKNPFEYRTVSKDRTGQICLIPERCVWWVAKMEGTGDDQVWNRMLTGWIDDSEEQDLKVLTRALGEAEQIPATSPGIRDEVLVCQEIWRNLAPVYVVIPFAKRIRFQSSANRRNPDMLLDLIKSFAIMRQYQRNRYEAEGMPYIEATTEDFRDACKLYQALNGPSGGQISKLTRKESELIDAISSLNRRELKISDLQTVTGWSYSTIQKMIHGYNSRGNTYSGLLEKCPAISFLDRTDITDGGETQRRTRVYAWDFDLYTAWASGGGCWLDGHEANSSHDDNDGGISGSKRQQTEGGGNFRQDSESIVEPDSDIDTITTEILEGWRKDEREEQSSSSSPEPVPTIISPAEVSPLPPPTKPGPSVFESKDNNQIRNIPPDAASAARTISHKDIKSRDYAVVKEGAGIGPCAVCGKKTIHYVERVTQERKAKPPRDSRKICKTCYDEIRQREADTYRALPGTLNTTGMRRWNTYIGKCHLCNLQEISWYNAEEHVGLCDSCYHREHTRKPSGGSI